MRLKMSYENTTKQKEEPALVQDGKAAVMIHNGADPRTLIVKNMAAMLIAGPAKRNVIAGPSPAPRFLIPANKGSIVHEQTARIAPETDAIA